MIQKHIDNIIEWAYARNIIDGSSPDMQFHKLIQECGEFSDDLLKGKCCKDELGDIFVCAIILSEQLNLEVSEVLEAAYRKIKDRKGQMKNGVFVKEQDL